MSCWQVKGDRAVTIETDAASPRQPPTPPVAPRVPSVRELHGDTVDRRLRVDARPRWTGVPRLPRRGARLLRREQPAPGRARHDAGGRGGEPGPGRRRVLGQLAPGRLHVPHAGCPSDGDNWQLLRSRTGNSSEGVLLDENLIAKQTGYAEVGVREPSPDGALLAWSADTSGAEFYELRIRDLRTARICPT